MNSHYDYLDKHLAEFFERCGVCFAENAGIIAAHGDKCYGYRAEWEKGGLHFYHGVAIYLLARVPPYSREVWETEAGWVDPGKWVLINKDRFLQYLPKVAPAADDWSGMDSPSHHNMYG